jgi:hypothetical protein
MILKFQNKCCKNKQNKIDFSSIQQKYTSYSGVCRLAKRWLASQFLIEYFEEEAIDLIVAYLFEHPSSHEAPK